MNGPQIVILVLIVFELGFALAKDGQPRVGNHSFGWAALSWSIIAGVLWATGFWTD